MDFFGHWLTSKGIKPWHKNKCALKVGGAPTRVAIKAESYICLMYISQKVPVAEYICGGPSIKNYPALGYPDIYLT
eukprot:6291579-Ditylum_brightwellii.AAC.1